MQPAEMVGMNGSAGTGSGHETTRTSPTRTASEPLATFWRACVKTALVSELYISHSCSSVCFGPKHCLEVNEARGIHHSGYHLGLNKENTAVVRHIRLSIWFLPVVSQFQAYPSYGVPDIPGGRRNW